MLGPLCFGDDCLCWALSCACASYGKQTHTLLQNDSGLKGGVLCSLQSIVQLTDCSHIASRPTKAMKLARPPWHLWPATWMWKASSPLLKPRKLTQFIQGRTLLSMLIAKRPRALHPLVTEQFVSRHALITIVAVNIVTACRYAQCCKQCPVSLRKKLFVFRLVQHQILQALSNALYVGISRVFLHES